MNIYIKLIINTAIIFVGVGITYWAGLKWYGTGFAFSSPFRTQDGNAFFYILLIGLAIIMYGVFENIDFFHYLKNDCSEKEK